MDGPPHDSLFENLLFMALGALAAVIIGVGVYSTDVSRGPASMSPPPAESTEFYIWVD